MGLLKLLWDLLPLACLGRPENRVEYLVILQAVVKCCSLRRDRLVVNDAFK
jgi:hypothetical protein